MFATPVTRNTHRARRTTARAALANMTRRRRSKRSAIAPACRPNSSHGRNCRIAPDATRIGDDVIDAISRGAAARATPSPMLLVPRRGEEPAEIAAHAAGRDEFHRGKAPEKTTDGRGHRRGSPGEWRENGRMTVTLLGATEIRRLAAELDVTPTKKLGQNFVTDANTVRKIVQAARVQPQRARGREVGPGLGSLTLAILETGASVTAVEIDHRLAARLAQTAAEHGCRGRPAHRRRCGCAAASPSCRVSPRCWSRTCRTTSRCPCCCTSSRTSPTCSAVW